MNMIEKTTMATRNKLAGIGVGATTLATTLSMAYATNPFSGAESTLTNLFDGLESTLKSIVVPIATCALIFCFIMMMVSQNQKKVESYRGWAITIAVCIVGIYAIPFIIALATSIGESLAASS